MASPDVSAPVTEGLSVKILVDKDRSSRIGSGAVARLRSVPAVARVEWFDAVERVTQSFEWAGIHTLTIAPSHRGAVLADPPRLWDDVCRALSVGQGGDDAALTGCLLRELYYGESTGVPWSIRSFYSWTASVTRRDREAALLEHLELERRQPLFLSVHFGLVCHRFGLGTEGIDFAFDGYCASRADIDTIYSSALLSEMRTHSSRFLAIDTRRLAFGRVQSGLTQAGG